jgi:hypothetical protein
MKGSNFGQIKAENPGVNHALHWPPNGPKNAGVKKFEKK